MWTIKRGGSCQTPDTTATADGTCFAVDGGGHGDEARHQCESSLKSQDNRENSMNSWEFRGSWLHFKGCRERLLGWQLGLKHTGQGTELAAVLRDRFLFQLLTVLAGELWLLPLLGAAPQRSTDSPPTQPPKHDFSAKPDLSLPGLHVLRHVDPPQQKLFLLEAASPPSCCAPLPLTNHSPLWLAKEGIIFLKKKKKDSIPVSLPGAFSS